MCTNPTLTTYYTYMFYHSKEKIPICRMYILYLSTLWYFKIVMENRHGKLPSWFNPPNPQTWLADWPWFPWQTVKWLEGFQAMVDQQVRPADCHVQWFHVPSFYIMKSAPNLLEKTIILYHEQIYTNSFHVPKSVRHLSAPWWPSVPKMVKNGKYGLWSSHATGIQTSWVDHLSPSLMGWTSPVPWDLTMYMHI